MTMSMRSPDLANRADLSRALAAPALRKSVSAMVRRRVPAGDVEDVAQTILCGALEASSIPSNPEDLRRFVAGIARHKVADYHRRARWVDLSAAPEPAVEPPPVEAREVLANIASSAASASDRERETLEWLVREHAGEPLSTIAADAGLPWSAVRQRVSRLRRALRAQWVHALALLVVVGAGAALAEYGDAEGSAIVADPTGDPVARAALGLQGTWHIQHVFPGATLPQSSGSDTSSASIEAKLMTLRIAGRRVEVVGPMHTTTLSITSVVARDTGELAIDLRDGGGRTLHALARIELDGMNLTLLDGPVRGFAQLTRR